MTAASGLLTGIASAIRRGRLEHAAWPTWLGVALLAGMAASCAPRVVAPPVLDRSTTIARYQKLLEARRRVGNDPGAGRCVCFIGEAGFTSCTGLNRDFISELRYLWDDLGYKSDSFFTLYDLRGYCDAHFLSRC